MSFSPLLFDASFEFDYSKYHANPYKKGLMAAAMEKSKRIPWRGILALIGGFLIQLTLGSFYSFGNMMTYMTSYMRFLGVRQSMFIGCTIFSVGTALTYFTLNQSLEYVALTYGFISAFGQGIALIPTMTIGMRWFPNRKGMAMGVVVGGFGGGAFIFNQIQTVILNPGNISPDPDDKYFTDEDLLSRVPGLMLILGAIYFIIQEFNSYKTILLKA